MTQYIKGQVARIKLSAKDADGLYVDPENLRLNVMLPDGSTIIQPWTRSALGRYYADLILDDSGTYQFHWASTGDHQSLGESSFYVHSPHFEA